MTSHTCSNYEIVSIEARNRLLLTVDVAELPMGFPESIDSAKLSDGRLVLQCVSATGSPFELCFSDMVDLDAAKLQRFQASLCGINPEGRVEFAKTFPSPSPAPRARMA